MPTISSYTPDIVIPNYRQTNFDSTLEFQVAAHNQQNYDRVLNTVRNLQSQALNIQMLNAEGKERLNEYNKKISEELSGDLGDLNKVEVQNKIANIFQTIAGDTALIKASKLSSEYQNQIDTIEAYRSSGRKDKGYNSINETVFKEWDGGLYDFMGSSLSKVTSPEFKPTKYTPFKELDTKLLNIAKTLHANTFIDEGSGGEGYIKRQELEQVSPERIRAMMLTQFDQEDLEQLDVLAKYEVIKHRKLGTIPDFYNKYNNYADSEIKRTQSQSDIKRQQAEYYQSLINNDKTPAEDKVKYLQLVNQLKQESTLYADAVNQLNASKKTLQDFQNMSNEELKEYASAIQWNTKINGLADALSWKKEVNAYKLDQVWKVNKEIDAMRWREELRANTRMNVERMRDASSKSAKLPEQPIFTGPIDSVKNTQSFYDSYNTLVSESEKYGRLTDRVISSPSFDSSQLTDSNFLNQNKDNYEVKMWDIFSHENPTLAIKDDKPQVEAFKLWLSDKENNPSGVAGQYITEFQRNKSVSDWMDMKLNDINKATRETTNEYDMLQGYPMYKADGSTLTREEYNAGTPAYLGVPTKSGTKLMKVDDVIENIKSDKQRTRTRQSVENLKIATPPGSALSMMTEFSNSLDPTGEYRDYEGNITDKGLVERMEKLIEHKKNLNTQLEKEMVGRLPQIFQNPLVIAMNDEAKAIYLPDVVSAAKNSNQGKDVGQFAISPEDIEFIYPPTTGEFGQMGLKPDRAKTLGELGWRLPDAADPTKTVLIQPGVSYSFRTNKPYMPYDALMNEVVKDIPIKQGYKGYQIEVSRSKITGNTYMRILDKNGNLVDSAETNQQVDVNKAIQSAQTKIETELNKKK